VNEYAKKSVSHSFRDVITDVITPGSISSIIRLHRICTTQLETIMLKDHLSNYDMN